MKKLLGIFICVFVLNSCDDGDVEIKNISFEDVEGSASCGDIVYKINGNQLLLIKISDASLLPYKNEVGVESIPISTSTKVIYRNYDGEPTAENICSNPPAATPNVMEEWTAIGGIIEITTTAVKETNTETNATRITKYNHNIVFKNIVFNKPNGDQTYETFIFGDYSTPTTLTYPFENEQQLEKCSSSFTVYSQIGKEALIINDIDPTLIENAATSSARIMNLSDAVNKLSYKAYNITISLDFFCGAATTPTILEEWTPDYTATSGIIEVTTTVATNGSTTEYTHEIHLKNVTLKKGELSFYLGDDFYYGNLVLQ